MGDREIECVCVWWRQKRWVCVWEKRRVCAYCVRERRVCMRERSYLLVATTLFAFLIRLVSARLALNRVYPLHRSIQFLIFSGIFSIKKIFLPLHSEIIFLKKRWGDFSLFSFCFKYIHLPPNIFYSFSLLTNYFPHGHIRPPLLFNLYILLLLLYIIILIVYYFTFYLSYFRRIIYKNKPMTSMQNKILDWWFSGQIGNFWKNGL